MRVVSHIVQRGEFRNKPAPIGHNGGPPLDLGWTAWNWRRAHAKAWKTPGREIVLLRARRAEQLGLSYRAYTSVLLDRGVRLSGLILMCSDALLIHEDKIEEKLAALRDCNIFVCGGGDRFEHLSAVTNVERDALPLAVRDAAGAAGTSPGAFFMVGSEDGDRRQARSLGLGLFVEAVEYFGVSCRKF
jgi:hypothetical protein